MRIRNVYLDYAATTPVDPHVRAAMEPYFSEKFGNPGSAHAWGQEAFRAVSQARKSIRDAFGCASGGVIFTASATEANNLAIRGVIAQARSARASVLPHMVTTAIEHDSVLEVCRALEREGLAEVSYVGVDEDGIADPREIQKTLRPETVLVSVMYANNEIGTIQPITEIAEAVREWKRENRNTYPLFHTDAVQAVQFLDCDMGRLGVDLMTISGHKIYGPKGGAALLMRDIHFSSLIAPILFGGGQEHGLRSGTENTPAIAGFGKAVELAVRRREKEARRLEALRDYFIGKLTALRSDIRLNGSARRRLPNNANVSFPGMAAEALVTALDRQGIAVSAGSACAAHAAKPSHVLEALGIPQSYRKSAVRFSFGKDTTKADLEYVIAALRRVFAK